MGKVISDNVVVLVEQRRFCSNLVMQPTLRTLLFIASVLTAQLTASSNISAADFSPPSGMGAIGNRGDSVHWRTNPNFPNNTGGVTYDATINNGFVTLDRDITLQRLFLNGDFFTTRLDGAFALNLNEGLNWTGGRIGNSTINLATGSTSTISTNSVISGTINNSGTVNQTGLFDMYPQVTGDSATINNLAGAIWKLQAGAAINPPEPFRSLVMEARSIMQATS